MSKEYSSTSFNEHTGALIKSRNSKLYQDNYDAIFGVKCCHCKKNIYGEVFTHGGRTFHEECLELMLNN